MFGRIWSATDIWIGLATVAVLICLAYVIYMLFVRWLRRSGNTNKVSSCNRDNPVNSVTTKLNNASSTTRVTRTDVTSERRIMTIDEFQTNMGFPGRRRTDTERSGLVDKSNNGGRANSKTVVSPAGGWIETGNSKRHGSLTQTRNNLNWNPGCSSENRSMSKMVGHKDRIEVSDVARFGELNANLVKNIPMIRAYNLAPGHKSGVMETGRSSGTILAMYQDSKSEFRSTGSNAQDSKNKFKSIGSNAQGVKNESRSICSNAQDVKNESRSIGSNVPRSVRAGNQTKVTLDKTSMDCKVNIDNQLNGVGDPEKMTYGNTSGEFPDMNQNTVKEMTSEMLIGVTSHYQGDSPLDMSGSVLRIESEIKQQTLSAALASATTTAVAATTAAAVSAPAPPQASAGKLHFSVSYDRKRSALIVAIDRATGLPAPTDSLNNNNNHNNMMGSNPYVRLQLLPDRRFKAKTRVAKKTLNPIFDETFTFYGLDFEVLPTISVYLVVLNCDRFAKDDIIGNVLLPLDGILNSLEEIRPMNCVKSVSFAKGMSDDQNCGKILISLCHQRDTDKLVVTVLKAHDLPKMDIDGLSDPFVKIYMLFRGQRIAKKRTRVAKRTSNPVFNESSSFDLTNFRFLHDVNLEFYVLHWNQLTKNEVIGKFKIGYGRGNDIGWRHWDELISSPVKQIAQWHPIKK